MGFRHSEGKQDGIDADIARLYAKELGVQVEFMPLEVNNRIPRSHRSRGRALRHQAMLPERAKARAVQQALCGERHRADRPKSAEIKSNADMAKFTIGVAKGAAQDTQVTKNALLAPPSAVMTAMRRASRRWCRGR